MSLNRPFTNIQTGPVIGTRPEQNNQRKLHNAIFPNYIAAGSFTPHSTIVEVSDFRPSAVKKSIENGDFLDVRKDIQVLCHEMTHWLDFFGTIWGHEYAVAICQGYRAVSRNKENDFPKIVSLFDRDRHILAPAYYRYTKQPDQTYSANNQWHIDFTCGIEIDPTGRPDERKPIFMVRFGNGQGGRPFARQPISVGALLESRAIASEMDAAEKAIATASDAAAATVERKLWEDEFKHLTYDHQLIEYHAPLHLVAFKAQINDLHVSSRLASRLAYHALNMQKDDFGHLRAPTEFNQFGKRTRAFLKNRDRGYAFACIVWNGGLFDGDEDAHVAKCLERSGLGLSENILKRTQEFLEKPLHFNVTDEVTDHFIREAAKGKAIAEAISAQPLNVATLEIILGKLKNICPPFMTNDLKFIGASQNHLNEFNPDILHSAAQKLREYTHNLLSGCRGHPF